MDSSASHLVKDQVLLPGQDYYWLRRTGLKHLAQLCSTAWTDFNEHDPGVTLLEALCYMLTQVGSRAALPIPKLLATGSHPPAEPFGPTQHALATPPPTTLADYEQLVLDKLPKLVKGITITPLLAADEAPTGGLYHVRIEPCPPPLVGLALDAQRLRDEVLHLLNYHRNLGDLFVTGTVLKLRPVAVSGQLELAAGQPPEPALTQLLLELGSHLPQLTANKDGTVPYFRRPLGLNTKLPEIGSIAQQAAIQLKYASQTAGVHTLRGMALHPLDNPGAVLADDEVALLDPSQTLAYLTVTQQGLLLSFDYRQVLQAYYAQVRYAEAWAESKPHPQSAPMAGHQRSHDHGSVQDLLPPLYGVSEEGPRPMTSASDRAAIMQFKGYMLLFDQLLANTNAQLANVGAYFAPTMLPAKPFYGLLYDVPYVAPLLSGTGGKGPGSYLLPDEAWNNKPDAVQLWQTYQRDPVNPYVQYLEYLAIDLPSVASGREKFLAHLLARFGYELPALPTRHGPPAGPSHEVAVAAYEHLLYHLETATYYRAAARLPDSADGTTHHYAESGLELMLRLLTGLEPLTRKWTHHGSLPDLEAQLQVSEEIDVEGPSRLVVRGPVANFAQVVKGLAYQLQPTAGPPAAAPSTSWYLKLTGDLANDQSWYDHLQRLADRLERFSLLDHAVLRPAGLVSPREKGSHAEEDPFYQGKVTLLLPGYAPRFRKWGKRREWHNGHNRQLVETFISQFAPAHLHVYVLWLGYRPMRRWEDLYRRLAHASGLLNHQGHNHAHALPEAQRLARRFLQKRLRHFTP